MSEDTTESKLDWKQLSSLLVRDCFWTTCFWSMPVKMCHREISTCRKANSLFFPDQLQWLSRRVKRYTASDFLRLILAFIYVCKYSHVVLPHVLATCSRRFHMFIRDISKHSSIKASLYLWYGFLSKVRSANQFPHEFPSLLWFNRSVIRYRQSIVTTGTVPVGPLTTYAHTATQRATFSWQLDVTGISPYWNAST